MNWKYKVGGVIILLAATFAAGRYSVKQTTEIKKVETTVDTDKVEHKKIVIEKKPTGETTTTITDDTDTVTKKVQEVKDVKTVAARNLVNVSALGAIPFGGGTNSLFGASITKEFPVLGVPLTVGPFGLTDKTGRGIVGLSLGINF